jgi:hypothetical protein
MSSGMALGWLWDDEKKEKQIQGEGREYLKELGGLQKLHDCNYSLAVIGITTKCDLYQG